MWNKLPKNDVDWPQQSTLKAFSRSLSIYHCLLLDRNARLQYSMPNGEALLYCRLLALKWYAFCYEIKMCHWLSGSLFAQNGDVTAKCDLIVNHNYKNFRHLVSSVHCFRQPWYLSIYCIFYYIEALLLGTGPCPLSDNCPCTIVNLSQNWLKRITQLRCRSIRNDKTHDRLYGYSSDSASRWIQNRLKNIP